MNKQQKRMRIFKKGEDEDFLTHAASLMLLNFKPKMEKSLSLCYSFLQMSSPHMLFHVSLTTKSFLTDMTFKL
jgi:hypothetical protein